MQGTRERRAGAPARVEVPSAVQLAHNRCPYCHTPVLIEADDWVACRRCLARHHHDCRGEAGACASCGDAGPALALQDVTPVLRVVRTARSKGTARHRLTVFVAAGLVALVVGLRAFSPDERPPRPRVQSVLQVAPAPDYLLGYLDFLESEGLYRTAVEKIQSSEYRHDPVLNARLARYQAELRR